MPRKNFPTLPEWHARRTDDGYWERWYCLVCAREYTATERGSAANHWEEHVRTKGSDDGGTPETRGV